MALLKDPWENLRAATPQPQPQQQQDRGYSTGDGNGGGLLSFLRGGGGGGGGGGGLRHPTEDNGFMDMLGQLGSLMVMMDPQTQSAGSALMQMQVGRREERKDRRAQNETAQWLQSEGVGPGEAGFLTSHPTALNAWYSAWKNGDKPDWQIHELFNDKGQKQKFMVDMKTGNLSPLGGSEVTKPKLSFQTIYDKDGKEQRALVNEDDGSIVTTIGGAKTDLLTEAELAQKERIAAAGRTQIDMGKQETEEGKTVGGEKGFGGYFNELQTKGRKAPAVLGTLGLMDAALADPDFVSGGPLEGEFVMKAKQWAKMFGWDPEGLTSMEAFSSLSKTSVMESVDTLGSGMSEGDRLFIVGQVPNMGYSKGGNQAIVKIQQQIQQRNMEVAKMARDYRKEKGHLDEGFDDRLYEWSLANPMFSEADKARILRIGQTPDPTPQGGGEGGDDFVDVPGRPGVRVRRGTTPPPVVTPVTPEPPPPQVQQVEPPAAPSILPDARQPRVRSILPSLPQPAPSRFR